MAERGGSANQSGVLYQNSITAIYLARLCDGRSRPASEIVVRVRAEALTHVDDTVVTFADGHLEFIQAKEQIRPGDETWRTLWSDFQLQIEHRTFVVGRDRLSLWTGEFKEEIQTLREACERARTSVDCYEWDARLTKAQKESIRNIRDLFRTGSKAELDPRAFFAHIVVELVTLKQIERDQVAYWVPVSNSSPQTVFGLLRDRVGGAARHKTTLTAADVRKWLASDHQIEFATPHSVADIEAAIVRSGSLLRRSKHTIGSTGTTLDRPVVAEITTWALGQGSDRQLGILLDRAGAGKTVVTRQTLIALASEGHLVLAIKADQEVTAIESREQLGEALGFKAPIAEQIASVAASKPVLVIVDQIDALSLNLSTHSRSLDILLGELASLCRLPGVRVLISCREFDRNTDPRLRRLSIDRTFTLGELSDDEVRPVVADLGLDYDSLPRATRDLLRVPLHLDLFARGIEAGGLTAVTGHPLASIQDLFSIFWKEVVLMPGQGAAAEAERIAAVRATVEEMASRRRTVVSQLLFEREEHVALRSAARWLTSNGVFVESRHQLSFFHQTFFDFCYAREFVTKGNRLHDWLVTTDQGLFVRSQVIQVLGYLRATDETAYASEVNAVLNDDALRVHLGDLVLKWFGALADPTESEWEIAQGLLANNHRRSKFLRAAAENASWFKWLAEGPLPSWLQVEVDDLDTDLGAFLASVVSSAQDSLFEVLTPYLGAGEKWDNRLANLLVRIRHWESETAAHMYEELCARHPSLLQQTLWALDDFASAFPANAIRLFASLLSTCMDKYSATSSMWASSSERFHHAFDEYSEYRLAENCERLAARAPELFLEAIVPWLERLYAAEPASEGSGQYFAQDILESWYARRTGGIEPALMASVAGALGRVAETDPESFKRYVRRLGSQSFGSAQLIIARALAQSASSLAHFVLEFLADDPRRLRLGDDVYESRVVVTELARHLDESGRDRLVALISTSRQVRAAQGLYGLRWSGLDQLFLLQAFPTELLPPRGRKDLVELERKFPGVRASGKPLTGGGGVVGSPIPGNRVKLMSDDHWLKAIEHYHGSVRHKTDFLKGGAAQLASLLEAEAKEHPERFAALAARLPHGADPYYLRALVSGVGSSEATADVVFGLIRQFAECHDADYMRICARALRSRAADGIPPDLIEYVQSVAQGTPWSDENHHDGTLTDYHNSVRGSAVQAVLRGLEKDPRSGARRFEIIEALVGDNARSMRVGAIEELKYVLHEDRDSATALFEHMIRDDPSLLSSDPVPEFLYWAIFGQFARLEPLLRALMKVDGEERRQHAAELAAIAALSPKVLESELARERSLALVEELIGGEVAWRRGAARVFAHNIDARFEYCAARLNELLNDEDSAVRMNVASAIRRLRGDQFQQARDFLVKFARSPALAEGADLLAQYLLDNALRAPELTLDIASMIARNQFPQSDRMLFVGGEDVLRAVLRVSLDPNLTGETRRRAMDVFDELLELFGHVGAKVLSEWDRR